MVAFDTLLMTNQMLIHRTKVLNTIALPCSLQITLDDLQSSLLLHALLLDFVFILHSLCSCIVSTNY